MWSIPGISWESAFSLGAKDLDCNTAMVGQSLRIVMVLRHMQCKSLPLPGPPPPPPPHTLAPPLLPFCATMQAMPCGCTCVLTGTWDRDREVERLYCCGLQGAVLWGSWKEASGLWACQPFLPSPHCRSCPFGPSQAAGPPPATAPPHPCINSHTAAVTGVDVRENSEV